MHEHPGHDDSEHSAMNELIPWYINGTIDEWTRRRLDRHLPTCPQCRADLEFERAVYARMATPPAVEYMPMASLKQLNAALDERQSGTKHDSDILPGAVLRARPAAPWRWLRQRLAVAASVGFLAAGLGILMLDRIAEHGEADSENYHTVTTARAKPPNETIRAVFAPDMTVFELQTVLDDARLRIVSGPTEAGVYSLAPTSALATDSSLEKLRRHAGVRFAETSQP